jgi:hypothetical protein
MSLHRLARIAASLSASLAVALAGCGGGGGTGDDGGGGNHQGRNVTGTGAGGVPTFWLNLGEGGAASVVETAGGGYLAAGSEGGGLYLVEVDARGKKLWDRSYPPGDPSVIDTAICLRRTSDGGYVLAGRRQTGVGGASPGARFLLLRLDASGASLAGWPRFYDDVVPASGNGSVVAESIGPSSAADGFVLVGSTAGAQGAVAKVGLDGTPLWTATIPGHDQASHPLQGIMARAVAQDDDGGFTVAGSVQVGGTPDLFALARVDAAGAALAGWATHGTGSAWDLARTEGGGTVAVGSTSEGAPQGHPGFDGDALVVKLNGDLTEAWRTVMAGGADDVVYGVAPIAGGADGYVVAGKSASYSQLDVNEVRRYETYLARLDASGVPRWRRAKGLDPSTLDSASAALPASDGGFVLAGGSLGYFLLAKTDAAGDTVRLGLDDLTVNVVDEPGTVDTTRAVPVAQAGLVALDNLREVGAFALDTLLAVEANPALNGAGGLSVSPAPSTLQAGQSYTLALAGYVTHYSGDAATLDGALTVDLTVLSRGLDDYAAALSVSGMDVTHADDSGTTVRFRGGLELSRTTSGAALSEVTQSGGATVEITAPGLAEAVSAFTFHRSSTATTFSLGQAGDGAVISLEGLEGPLSLGVQAPIVGSLADPVHPGAGALALTADDSSSVTATIGAAGVITLSVDADGDGTADGWYTTTFDELE